MIPGAAPDRGRIAVLGEGPAADAIRQALPGVGEPVPASADLVIEATADLPRAAKATAVAALLADLPTRIPIGVATRLHTLDALLPAARHGGRVVGLHLVAPRLAEVAMPDRFDDAVVDRVLELLEASGIAVLPCGDGPGRIVDRLLLAAVLDARGLVRVGDATPEQVDRATRDAGIPLAALAEADVDRVAAAVHAASGAPERYAPVDLPGPASAEPGAVPQRHAATLSDAAIATRLELAVIAEAYRLVGEAVAGAGEIERAMTDGAGWAAGPFTLAGRRGLRGVVTGLTALARDPAADAAARDRFRMPPLLWQMATA